MRSNTCYNLIIYNGWEFNPAIYYSASPHSACNSMDSEEHDPQEEKGKYGELCRLFPCRPMPR